MNEQEAIIIIEKDRDRKCDTLYALPINARKNAVELNAMIEAQAFAVIALEKQIAKKPKTIINEFDDFKIGNVMFGKGTKIYRCQCSCFITKTHDYCPKCGQKLDWSVEE